ncbi:MAG: glutamate--tRNA ligase family protein [Candidatus Shikimatogenerans sp. JK-2022]|nr:glutamate--tRNA ligase family protein [Candidatus Shikimatogenerans bostrichidophilus]
MKNFIIKIIKKDIDKGLSKKKIRFRFAPEPNGFLHIGHVKAIYLNFKLAKFFNSPIILRFDDTNPKTSNLFFVKKIIENIKWLGFKWNKLSFTSDYFDILYKLAKKLIKKKKAYIQYKKNNKIINFKNIEKNLFYFKNMKKGKYNENKYVLRAKINLKSSNYHLKDPVMYRIIKKKHFKTLNKWCIFPTYDWAHGQTDYIEKISHSLCSIEFENHRPLYNWFLKYIYSSNFNNLKPKQIEFARLNFFDSITSKRKLIFLKKKQIIKNFSDIRLSTIDSFKKKGYKPIFLKNFIKNLGYTKRNINISIEKLNSFIKKYLIKKSDILMVILNPIKLIITNFKKKIKWIFTKDKKYKIPFTKIIFIEKEDFKEKHDKNFYRLSFKNYVRLKFSYIIKAYKIIKNKKKIIKILCKIYKKKKKKKIKSTIQWVSNFFKKKINIINYKYIFFKKNKIYNINSIKKKKGIINLDHKFLKKKKIYQFLRIGFFYLYKKKNFLKIFYFKKKY